MSLNWSPADREHQFISGTVMNHSQLRKSTTPTKFWQSKSAQAANLLPLEQRQMKYSSTQWPELLTYNLLLRALDIQDQLLN